MKATGQTTQELPEPDTGARHRGLTEERMREKPIKIYET